MANTKTTAEARQKKPSAAQLLRERQIAAYREQMAQAEETSVRLEEERNNAVRMNMMGVSVTHAIFGCGTVTGQEDAYLTVRFEAGDKRFLMPSAFADGFLQTGSAEVNERLQQYRKLGEQIMTLREDAAAAARSIQMLEKK